MGSKTSKEKQKKPKVAQHRRREKGNNYERKIINEVCSALDLTYGKDLKRRPMGDEGNDCMHLSRAGIESFPFAVEAKDRRNWSLSTWWKKLIEVDTDRWQIPIVIAKNYTVKEDFVVIRLSDFCKILGILKRLGGMKLLGESIDSEK